MHRPVLSLFLGHFGHGEGEQVGDVGLLDVGDVDGLVHLALDLPHEALLAHDHLEGGLEVVLDSRGDVLHVIQTLVPPVHLKRPLMVHNHNVVVVLELVIFKLYPDMVGESLGPDDGADPEAGVLGLQLGDAGVDGGGVVEDVLLVWQPGLHLCNQGQEFRPVSAVGWGRLLKTAPGRTAASIRIVLLGLASGPAPGTHYNIGLLLLWRYFFMENIIKILVN